MLAGSRRLTAFVMLALLFRASCTSQTISEDACDAANACDSVDDDLFSYCGMGNDVMAMCTSSSSASDCQSSAQSFADGNSLSGLGYYYGTASEMAAACSAATGDEISGSVGRAFHRAAILVPVVVLAVSTLGLA